MTELDLVHLGAGLAGLAVCAAYVVQQVTEPRESIAPPPIAPRLPSGRRASARVGPDEQRLAVAHRGPRAPYLRIGRTGGCTFCRTAEWRLPFADARFTVFSAEHDDLGAARLAAALPVTLLEELLPVGVWRWLEVRAGEVALVRRPRAEPLERQLPTFLALERLAVVVELLPRIAVAPRPAGLRCAYCHDGLGLDPRRCAGCGTLLHAECGDELGGCPTAGCARAPLPARATS